MCYAVLSCQKQVSYWYHTIRDCGEGDGADLGIMHGDIMGFAFAEPFQSVSKTEIVHRENQPGALTARVKEFISLEQYSGWLGGLCLHRDRTRKDLEVEKEMCVSRLIDERAE